MRDAGAGANSASAWRAKTRFIRCRLAVVNIVAVWKLSVGGRRESMSVFAELPGKSALIHSSVKTAVTLMAEITEPTNCRVAPAVGGGSRRTILGVRLDDTRVRDVRKVGARGENESHDGTYDGVPL
jgi:hypothetical protein